MKGLILLSFAGFTLLLNCCVGWTAHDKIVAKEAEEFFYSEEDEVFTENEPPVSPAKTKGSKNTDSK